MTPYADKYGIDSAFHKRICNQICHGLVRVIQSRWSNVVVLSDYDDSGILLASNLNIPRIGIDADTLKYFNLEREYLEERYNPKKHIRKIRYLVSREEYEYSNAKESKLIVLRQKPVLKNFGNGYYLN